VVLVKVICSNTLLSGDNVLKKIILKSGRGGEMNEENNRNNYCMLVFYCINFYRQECIKGWQRTGIYKV
jgi:hypothetical protein